MADSEADSEALSTQADEDSRLKYLGNTRDARYTERSLLLRFHTTERGERRLLLLNLRKGYLKQGEWFGTKVYLSRAPAAAPTRTPPPSPPRRLPPHTAAPPLVPSGTASTPPSHAALPRRPPTLPSHAAAAQRCRARIAASAWRARRRPSRRLHTAGWDRSPPCPPTAAEPTIGSLQRTRCVRRSCQASARRCRWRSASRASCAVAACGPTRARASGCTH